LLARVHCSVFMRVIKIHFICLFGATDAFGAERSIVDKAVEGKAGQPRGYAKIYAPRARIWFTS
jgi:hypothetical protein